MGDYCPAIAYTERAQQKKSGSTDFFVGILFFYMEKAAISRSLPREDQIRKSCLPILEAIVAVNGTICAGFERNLAFFSAVCAYSIKHGAVAATCVFFASLTASFATLGLVCEALFSIEFLFTGGENEFLSAIFAD